MICPACQRENPEGNVFCGSCGARLTGRDPRTYAPPHLADAILRTRSDLEGERKSVTVLFADVCDSTALAERVGAEGWHAILEQLFAILCEAVYRFEGTVNQFTGDGIMALFGAPIAHEDHARRACLAALRLSHRLEPLAERLAQREIALALRVGLNSGEVVVGKIGDDLRMDYTAQGAAVSIAARLEEQAQPGSALISEHTARLVEGLFELEDEGPKVLRGIREPVPCYRLVARGPLHSRLDVARARGLSPLLGRDEELAGLRELLDRASRGEGSARVLVGEPGVGKSRLGLELAREARADDFAVVAADCPSHAARVPWLFLQTLLRSYFGVGADTSPERTRARVEGRLGELGLDAGRLTGVAAALLEGGDEKGPPEPPLELLHRLVQAQSARQPTLWLLDDVQWSDPESERALAEMVEALRWTRTALLATTRPGGEPAWSDAPDVRRSSVSPLSDAQGGALAAVLLGAHPSLGDLAARVAARTGGNPLFCEEVIGDLARRGWLDGEPGAYRSPGREQLEAAELALPETVQLVVAARIDALDERAKRLLGAAAVAERLHDDALLARVAELSDEEAGPARQALERAELVRDGGFTHPLIQEVAYGSLLADRRRALHRAVAIALEHTGELGRVAELIAYHWEAGHRAWLARRWRHRAALRVANIQLSGRRRAT